MNPIYGQSKLCIFCQERNGKSNIWLLNSSFCIFSALRSPNKSLKESLKNKTKMKENIFWQEGLHYNCVIIKAQKPQITAQSCV